MILIELEGRVPRRFGLEFHPKLTIVGGLSPQQRHDLAASLTGALAGSDTGIDLIVDVGGEPQRLTPDLIHRLGLSRQPVDNVIEPADLPGAVVKGSPGGYASQLPEDFPVAAGSDDGPLAAARMELQTCQARAGEVAQRLDEARRGHQVVDAADVELALELKARADARLAELRNEVELFNGMANPGATKAQRLARLHKMLESTKHRVAELNRMLEAPPADPQTIRVLLMATQSAGDNSEITDLLPELQDALDAWNELNHQAERLSQQPMPPQWLVSQTKDELDEAEARITAFTYQLHEGIDVSHQLERAREVHKEAKAAWDEIENGAAGQMAALQEERQRLYSSVRTMIGIQFPLEDVPHLLENEIERIQAIPDPHRDLAEALRAMGLDADLHDAVFVAEKWLKSQHKDAERRGDLQQELAAATVDYRDLTREIAETKSRDDEPEIDPAHRARLMGEMREAEAVAKQATVEAMEKQRARARGPVVDREELAELERQYRAALDEMEAAGLHVDYFTRLSMSAGSSEPARSPQPTDRPWWEGGATQSTERSVPVGADVQVDVSGVVNHDVDSYVLGRVAGLRMAARGESLPLIIDGAFDDLPSQLSLRILEALSKIASFVQVIYLASSDVPEKWARRQDERLAAVVHVVKR